MAELVVPVVFDDAVLFRAGEDPTRPLALYTIAYGRRHPTGPGQLSVYEIAHRRLNA